MLNRKLKCQLWAVKQMLTVAYQAVYGILSEDKQQVEVFASDLPENTVLDVVKGGYISKDGKVRLMKTKTSWKISK